MLTSYKKEDLGDLIDGNHELYNELSLIGDKLRIIYLSLGWTHMLGDFSKADDNVEYLTNSVLAELSKGADTPSHSTAGLSVTGYFDEEEYLNLDYNFVII